LSASKWRVKLIRSPTSSATFSTSATSTPPGMGTLRSVVAHQRALVPGVADAQLDSGVRRQARARLKWYLAPISIAKRFGLTTKPKPLECSRQRDGQAAEQQLESSTTK
jgi:hypothetical protein